MLARLCCELAGCRCFKQPIHVLLRMQEAHERSREDDRDDDAAFEPWVEIPAAVARSYSSVRDHWADAEQALRRACPAAAAYGQLLLLPAAALHVLTDERCAGWRWTGCQVAWSLPTAWRSCTVPLGSLTRCVLAIIY